MGCGEYQWKQVDAIDRALSALSPYSYLRELPGYKELFAARARLVRQLTGPFPRATTLLKFIPFLSPGQIRVWYDSETGWIVEGRKSPGAPPTLRSVDQATALAVMDPEAPEELLHKFEEPDPYIGE
jgi:hypothetical protein